MDQIEKEYEKSVVRGKVVNLVGFASFIGVIVMMVAGMLYGLSLISPVVTSVVGG
jgi:hypothetical protein